MKKKNERKKERIIGFAHVETDPRGGGYCNIASPPPKLLSKNKLGTQTLMVVHLVYTLKTKNQNFDRLLNNILLELNI